MSDFHETIDGAADPAPSPGAADLIQKARLMRRRRKEAEEAKEAHRRLWEFLHAAAGGIGAYRSNSDREVGWWHSPRADCLIALGAELVAQEVADWALANVECPLTRELLAEAIKGDEDALRGLLTAIDPNEARWRSCLKTQGEIREAEEEAHVLQVTVQNALVRLRQKWDQRTDTEAIRGAPTPGTLPPAPPPALAGADQRGGTPAGVPPAPSPAAPLVAGAEEEVPQSTLLSAPDLAQLLSQTVPRVESFLRRYRKAHPDCFVTVDEDDRRRNQAKYLYRTAEVLPALRAGRTGG
jgi:hypothetical protein